MPWTVDYSEQEVISLVIVGRQTFGDVIEETAAIVAEMERRRCNRVLVDCTRTRIALSTAEIYRVQNIYRDLGMPLHSQIAILMPGELPTHELHAYEFHELVSRNRGYHVRLFRDRSEAEVWLGVESAGPSLVDNGGS